MIIYLDAPMGGQRRQKLRESCSYRLLPMPQQTGQGGGGGGARAQL